MISPTPQTLTTLLKGYGAMIQGRLIRSFRNNTASAEIICAVRNDSRADRLTSSHN